MVDMLDLRHPLIVPEPEPASEPAEQEMALRGLPESIAWDATHPAARSQRELMFLGGVMITGSAIAWWQASWITFVMVLVGIATWEVHSRVGSSHHVHIDHRGITVGSYRHRYEHLDSFDIHTMPDGTHHVSIKPTRWHLPQLHIPLGDQDPEQVNAVLSQYLIRDEHKIPYATYFLKKL